MRLKMVTLKPFSHPDPVHNPPSLEELAALHMEQHNIGVRG